MCTQWFDVRCGLMQGCFLSPLLFTIYINELIPTSHGMDIGVRIDDKKL